MGATLDVPIRLARRAACKMAKTGMFTFGQIAAGAAEIEGFFPESSGPTP
jgi:hypothetical protein